MPADALRTPPQAFLGLLMKARPHLDIAHHVKGRIRLAFGPGILRLAEEVDPDLLKGAFAGLRGIRSTRINALGATLVIEYDPALMPPAWWEALVRGSSTEAQAILGTLLEGAAFLPSHPSPKENSR